MKKKDNSLAVFNNTGLVNPGDKASAYVTKTSRKVIKVEKNNGTQKYSATQYPNGTIVETRTTKTKK